MSSASRRELGRVFNEVETATVIARTTQEAIAVNLDELSRPASL